LDEKNSEDFQIGQGRRSIWQSEKFFILTLDWLMESIQIFLKLHGLFKAEGNIPAKIIKFILNLKSWQKLIKKIDLSAILDFDAAIYLVRRNRKGTKIFD